MSVSTPSSASASPSPVYELTPVAREAAVTSWPSATSRETSRVPMSPVPPMTAIFTALTVLRSIVDRTDLSELDAFMRESWKVGQAADVHHRSTDVSTSVSRGLEIEVRVRRARSVRMERGRRACRARIVLRSDDTG